MASTATSPAATSTSKPACKHLVLDAGPIISLTPLRGLAETYYTTPQVLSELQDRRAREHFEKLGLATGVSVKVADPDPASLLHVIQSAKKTGDYSVLSTADLRVLALTYELDKKEREEAEKARDLELPEESPTGGEAEQTLVESTPVPGVLDIVDLQPTGPADLEVEASLQSEAEGPPPSEPLSEGSDLEDNTPRHEEVKQEPLRCGVGRDIVDVVTPTEGARPQPPSATPIPPQKDSAQIYDDPSDDEDGEGEWITPSNVSLHKSRAMNLLPQKDAKNGRRERNRKQIAAGCMTADFAMQNVLLQMGLNLVGVEGKRIEKVKTWVLRCHGCFKICKDNSRKFCPSCGNTTLLRASVTLSSPTATSSTPTLTVHLKQNFQYKTRGTIYSIPAPKPGSAKKGSGEGLILREDQIAWQRAKKLADGKREREEKRLMNAAANSLGTGEGKTVGALGSWMDPDWIPEIVSVGAGGKGRTMKGRGMDGDMPVIGYGKKNPNERKRRK